MNVFPLRHRVCFSGLMVLWLLLAAGVANADLTARAKGIINAADLRKTQVGVMIFDVDSGSTLVDINADEPMIPASNMKVLTTAGALQLLGPEYVFRTELRLLPPGAAGSPGHSLVIHGDGDPAFGDPDLLAKHGLDIEKLLDTWVQAIKVTGIRQIDQLIMDDRVFDQDFVHPSWPADQLNQWYCAEVAGINFNNNCLDIYPEPTAMGQSPRVLIWPQVPALNLTNRATTGTSDTFWVSRKPGSNDMIFYGKVKNKRSSPINVTLHDPPIFFGQLLQHRLGQEGVTVSQVVRPASDTQLPAGQVLHVIQTTIDQVIERCNKDSQNLFAEALFKRIGRKVTGQPGSWENGSAAMRIFLHSRLGARSAVMHIADGSGLSRDNRVTARSMVDIITLMARDPKMSEPFIRSLSVGGQDGTLRKRFGELQGSVVLGKSGYINKVSTLSGLVVVTDKSRPTGLRTIAFSLLFNEFNPPVYVHQVREVQDNLVKLIHDHLQVKVSQAN